MSTRPPAGKASDVTKPYKFIGFGAIDVTKPYKFIGFGAGEYPTSGRQSQPEPSLEVESVPAGAGPPAGKASRSKAVVHDRQRY